MKKRFFITLLYLITLLLPSYGTRRALVIGISEYRDARWMHPRISAERDAMYVKKVLNATGFQNSNIKVLKNKVATKDNIVSSFRQMADECQPGDIVYVHFSGHGQLMTDVNGDEKPDVFGERWDEAWVPYDASFSYDKFDQGSCHLCDDEIYALLSNIRKKIGKRGEILVVVDACHSGDSTRDIDEDDETMESCDTTSYNSIVLVTRGTNQNFVIPSVGKKQKSASSVKEDWITVSACKSYQLNSEMQDAQGLRIGMLTYGIYTLMPKITTASNEEFESMLANFMKKNRHPKSLVSQSPQIAGTSKSHCIKNVFGKQ